MAVHADQFTPLLQAERGQSEKSSSYFYDNMSLQDQASGPFPRREHV